MKNLKIKNINILKIDNEMNIENNKVIFLEEERKIYLIKNNILFIQTLNENMKELTDTVEIELLKEFKDEQIIKIISRSFYDNLIILTKSGNFLIFNTETNNMKIENYFKSEINISTAEISPNEDNIIILTKEGDLYKYDKLSNLEKKINIFENKFSSENKNLKSANISWRFDSEFFSLVYETELGVRSMTYTKSLEMFHSPSLYNNEYPLVINFFEEDNKNLANFSSWSSNGNLIASILKKENNKKFVVLWEKNVLAYEEFEIEQIYGERNISGIFWHPKHNMLFLHIKNENCSNFVIYMKSNGSWRLKNTIKLDNVCVYKKFADERLFLFLDNNEIFDINLNLNSDTFLYEHNSEMRYGLGIFIENFGLAVTPYDKFMIPAPLSLTKVNHSCNITNFDFEKNYLFFLDFDNKLSCFKYSFPKKFDKIEMEYNLENYLFLRNMKVIKNEDNFEVFFMATKKEEDLYNNFLLNLKFKLSENKLEFLELKEVDFEEDQKIDSLEKFENKIYLLVNHSDIFVFDDEIGDIEHFLETNIEEEDFIKNWKLAKSQNQIEIHNSQDGQIQETQNIDFICLNKNDKLFYNNIQISEDCTSFLIFKEYFLFTMLSSTPFDQLYCLTLNSIKNGYFERPTPSVNSESKNLTKRNIEKNATLVCCSDTQVLFQLPRGNFEGIHHRIFLVEKIKNLVLNEGNYKEAFFLVRKHKLNSNLLIDLDIEKFCAYIRTGKMFDNWSSKFIDIFVLDLTNKFSEELKFIFNSIKITELKSKNRTVLEKSKKEKVNFICELFEEEMMKDQDRFILHLMVIYTKKNPKNLKKALLMIKELKSQQNDINIFKKKAPHLTTQKIQNKKRNYKEVLKYLSWLAKADELYNLSLSIYDLELTLMVAEFTLMDPKEYLPYIEILKNIKNEIDFKTRICLDMKNYGQALRELVNGDEKQISQALEIIQEQLYFIEGLEVFKHNEVIVEKIKIFYGKFLFNKKDYKNAALFLQNNEESIKDIKYCYEKTLDWENAFIFFKKKNIDEKEIEKFVQKVTKEYTRLKAYPILAKMSKSLNSPLTTQLTYIIKSQNYKKAKKILTHTPLTPLQKKTLKEELSLQASIENNKIAENLKNHKKWTKRLKAVQERKTTHKMQGIDDDNLTLMSDITSIKSHMTGMTSENFSVITGMQKLNIRKNKKPKNLSRRRYKENSVYEEEWLVESLNLIDFSKEEEKNLEHFLSLLILVGLVREFKEVKGNFEEMARVLENGVFYKSLKQREFEEKNHEVYDLYNSIKDFDLNMITPGKKRKFEILKKYGNLH